MDVFLVSFLCVEFEARPMPEDLPYFVPANEDHFLENAKKQSL
jgi:hypothetical protein